ncbi:MAG: phospholipase [Planctomycetes bacterium]|nr:phospholipase [Planctomycetota bacterium]
MTRTRTLLWLGLGFLLLLALRSVQAASAHAASGARLVELQSGGMARWYRVHTPPQFDPQTPTPVVLAFHGGGGNAVQFMNQSGLNAAADRHGFVVVYPEGTGKLGGKPWFRLQTWNAGSCCGYASEQNIDDVGFVRDLLADLDQRMTIETGSVFATGHSNGGMLCYRLAIEAPELFAAIAPNASCRNFNGLPQQPMPIIAFHGALDCNVPWQGGVGCGVSGVWMRSQRDSLLPFLQINGATLPPRQPPAERRGKALRYEATAAQSGADVHYWWMLDHGHAWPGHGSAIGDPCNFDIDINEEMWVFFDRYRG